MILEFFKIHKRLIRYLNSQEKRVLVEKFNLPKVYKVNGDVIFYFRYYRNGEKKQVITFFKNKFTEECFYDIEGKLHRDHDLPAWISTRGIHYFRHGDRHRGFDKPAFIGVDGTLEYWVNGLMHKRVINKPFELYKCFIRFYRDVKSVLKR